MSRTGLILAGGKSSRMQQDKALMLLNGKAMARHVSDILIPFCDEVLVASNRFDHAIFGDRLIADEYPGYGPLAGVHAGLTEATNDECIVLSCDVPFVTTDVIASLIGQSGNFDAVIARCNKRVHPLVGIYHKSALETIENALRLKNLKMLNCVDNLNVRFVDFPSSMSGFFQNINTPEDLKSWQEV